VKEAYEFLIEVCKNTKYLYRLAGYARSGQHAVSNWLLSQAPNTSLWVNNIQNTGVDTDFQHYWYGPVSLENIHLTGLGFEGDIHKTQQHFPETPLILVIRDIFNQTASIARHPELKLDTKYFEGWERNARQALGQLDIIKSPLVVAKFNDWASSEDYRRELFAGISDLIGFSYCYQENREMNVLNIGGGSSFDGLDHQFSAKSMKVLERYKDPSVQDAISQIPERLKLLSQRLFPDIG